MVLMSLPSAQQQILLHVARQSIEHGLRHHQPLPVNPADFDVNLQHRRACFVTLERHGQLRGCIGMLEAVRALAVDVAENAFAAAFRDPRFPALSGAELEDLELHISILGEPQVLQFFDETSLLCQLQPGKDGLILQEGSRRATFLPSVWQQLPEAGEFLAHLKLKAGLPAHYWSDSLQVSRYQCQIFGAAFVQC